MHSVQLADRYEEGKELCSKARRKMRPPTISKQRKCTLHLKLRFLFLLNVSQ